MISTLKSRYIFEDQHRCILLKNGIIDILSEILDKIVGSSLTIDTRHRFRSKKSVDDYIWTSSREYIDPVTVIV